MWAESSEDETGPISCDRCRRMIKEEEYRRHWRACKGETTLKQEKIEAVSAASTPRKVEEIPKKQQMEVIRCENCFQDIQLSALSEHMESCQQMLVECSFCSTKVPLEELEAHEGTCDSNPNRRGISLTGQQMAQLLALLANRNIGAHGSNPAGSERRGPVPPALNPTEDLLQNSLFPALRKLDKGIKKRDLGQFPTQQYKKGEHSQDKCSICQQQFKQGDTVMKATCCHIQHEMCYKDWLLYNNTCPLCKAVIKPEKKPSK